VAYILKRALSEGRLRPGQEIVEATTGNTGIALAMAGRRLGHPVRLVVPDTAFVDVRQALMAWEPRIEWVSASQGIKSAIAVAEDIALREGAFPLQQFSAPENVQCHYETTGAEILAQCPDLSVFVCGLGTSGTAMGVGRRLKEHNPSIQVVAAEPHPGQNVQGLRSLEEGYMPPILDLSVLDSKFLVRSSDAFRGTRALLRREGLLVGPSSGAVLHAALKCAQRLEHGNIVMLFADSGWKYINSPAFHFEDSLADEQESFDEILWW
jgi:cysteine synthase B